MTSRQRAVYVSVRTFAGRLRYRLVRRGQPAQQKPATKPSAAQRPGRVPEAERKTTHLGPVMDNAVFQAKRRMRIGVDPDYDLLYDNFDVMHYLLQAQRMTQQPGTDLIGHFLRTGVKHRYSPDIHFSMENYLQRYPEKEHSPERNPYLEWLKKGRPAGEIADPAPAIPEMAHILGLTPEKVIDLLVARRTDVVDRLTTGVLGEMVARAAEIEPLISRTHVRFTRPRLLPFGHPAALDQVAALHAAHEAAAFRRARLVLVVNRARWGGGRRMEGHIAHAVAAKLDPEDIVVVYTDKSGSAPAGRFPIGVREIDFAALSSRLEPEDAETALVVLIRTFQADAVINFNSATLYQAMQSYGRALAASERVFPCFFCNEQTLTGAWTGWSLRYFYRTFDYTAGVITDSEHLADRLSDAYKVRGKSGERLHVFRAPVDPELPVVTESPAAPGRRPQVFWAGRWDRQKRIGLLREIARRMPDVDFRVWGEPVMGSVPLKMPSNVTVEGRYGHISEIPLAQADAWLYTSRWDGVPSQLLEVAMTGIPIVGTLVGGTGEVIGNDAWPVHDQAGADAYETSLRDVLDDPYASRRTALALRQRMLRERTAKAFTAQVTEVLLVDHDADKEQPR